MWVGPGLPRHRHSAFPSEAGFTLVTSILWLQEPFHKYYGMHGAVPQPWELVLKPKNDTREV